MAIFRGPEPPATGGSSATSSPSASTVLSLATTRFTAVCTRGSSDSMPG
jgi:hypothetical protein